MHFGQIGFLQTKHCSVVGSRCLGQIAAAGVAVCDSVGAAAAGAIEILKREPVGDGGGVTGAAGVGGGTTGAAGETEGASVATGIPSPNSRRIKSLTNAE